MEGTWGDRRSTAARSARAAPRRLFMMDRDGISAARSGDPRGLALGFASHLLAGLSPFIVAAVIARTSLLPGTALVYVLGATALALVLVVPRWRRRLGEETRRLTRPPLRGPFVSSLAGFLVAGVAYYVGLASSARVAEYVFLTRLDWVVQAPVAILVLREPWTRAGLGGAALALAGGLLIVWTGIVGSSGLLAALCYVIASLAGYLGATRIARARGLEGAVATTARSCWRSRAGRYCSACSCVASRRSPACRCGCCRRRRRCRRWWRWWPRD